MENTSTHSTSTGNWPWMNTSHSSDERAALLLAQMTLEEKVDMLNEKSSAGMSTSRLGIPALAMADGPAGIRIDRNRRDIIEGRATSPPAPIALAATWDLAAAQQYGDMVGQEAWATGHTVLFGPGLDIARIPVFGRLFEVFGEDPVLTGQMAARYIQGVQHHPVIATAKHYNVNAQEENRLEVDAQLDERALQEIYTLPFAVAVQDGLVGAVMGAYNKVNNIYSCENHHLLTEILKRQLGFAGWVVSDFEATRSTVEAANAGLDVELGTAKFFGDRLLQAIQTGQVSLVTLDDKVRRILRTMFALELFDSPIQITPLPEQEHGKLARGIAGKGIVLLKNTGGLLPLSNHELNSLAVIGADMLPGLPLVPSSVLTPSGSGQHVRGLHAEYWTNTHFEGEPRLVRIDRQVALNLGFFNFGSLNASSLTTPEEFNYAISVRWTGSLTAPVTGAYTLSLTHLGRARLFLDGRLLIENPGITLGTRSVTLQLVAGQPYALRIEYAADRPEQITPEQISMAGLIGSQVCLGWEHPAGVVPPPMHDAAALARRSDAAVVVVRDYRNEHTDLPSLTLPSEQNLLIQAVAAANPRTIVVVASGGPVLMPWLEQVPAVLESWYGGQELGNALADVLFGDVTPSGKLPVTFPRSERDTPVSEHSQYSRTASVAHFSEGLCVGYRGYDKFGIEPLFPFGYGLSYTSFAYSQLQVEPETTDGSRPIRVCFTIKNTGAWAGAEIVQVYFGLLASTGEPPKRLVGWSKVELVPGETKEVSVTLDPNAASRPLSYWNVNTSGWEIANGDYQVYVGASSRDIRLTGTLHIHDAEKE